jgi:uncharacterized phage protein (TIGR01671 family)
MREIKFRAKRSGINEWVIGLLVIGVFGDKLMQREDKIGDDMVLIDPETLGQYTGLKDKNGKEIYEGDIYIAERSYMPSRGHKRKGYPNRIKVICVAEWSIYDAGWRTNEISPIKEHIEFDENCPYHYHHTSLGGSTNGSTDWIEVIGNIYQNPELLTNPPLPKE